MGGDTAASRQTSSYWEHNLGRGHVYVPGVSGVRREGILELASNENPFGPSPAALAACQEALFQSHLYPEHDAGEIRRALSAAFQVAPEEIIVTPGTTTLIDLVARTLLGPGTSAVVSARSFLAYTSSVALTGATLRCAPMQQDTIDLEAVLETLQPDTRVVFLANPNNPTGTTFHTDAWDRFLSAVPPHILVVLDEAYAEYAEDIPDGLAALRRGANVLILRTFSKVYGLAGLRVGYGIGSAPLIQWISRAAVPFHVSHPAQRAARLALADKAFLERSIHANRVGRHRLLEGLRALGLNPTPSQANFVYLELGRPATPVAEALLKLGIRIRPLGAWGMPTAVRITVGSPEAITRVLEALSSVPRELLYPSTAVSLDRS